MLMPSDTLSDEPDIPSNRRNAGESNTYVTRQHPLARSSVDYRMYTGTGRRFPKQMAGSVRRRTIDSTLYLL